MPSHDARCKQKCDYVQAGALRKFASLMQVCSRAGHLGAFTYCTLIRLKKGVNKGTSYRGSISCCVDVRIGCICDSLADDGQVDSKRRITVKENDELQELEAVICDEICNASARV